MTLRHLHIFRTVCHTGSITEAAARINMTQPAVSLAIKELESFYQTRLFERRNRKIYLTDSGKALLPYAETILNQFKESTDVLRREHIPESCRLGVNVTVAETRLSDLAAHLLKKFPSLNLSVQISSSDAIEKMLTQNEIDLAIMDRLPRESFWHTKLLYTEEMSVVTGSAHPPAFLSVPALSRERLLLREKGSGSRAAVDAVFSRHSCLCTPLAESSSSTALIRMAEKGLGFTILSKELTAPSVQAGRLTQISLLGDAFLRHYYLIWHQNKYLTKTLNAVISVIQDMPETREQDVSHQ